MILTFIFLFSCNNSTNQTNSKNECRVISIQKVNDTVISYGSYPDLPSRLSIQLNDSSITQINVDWDHSLKPVVPGVYNAVGRYCLIEFGGGVDSIIVNITIKPCDSIKTSDSFHGYYLGYGSDLSGRWTSIAVLPDSMVIYEKPIDRIQYLSKIIQTEKSRIQFKKNIDVFLGFSSDICNDPLMTGEIKIVTAFIYKYKTSILDEKLIFRNKSTDSLYRTNPDAFKSYYGNVFNQQITFCRYFVCEENLIPKVISSSELSAEICKLNNSLSLPCTSRADFSKFNLVKGHIKHSLPIKTFADAWYHTKSAKQFYNEFKNVVDSCKLNSEYYESFFIGKNYY